MGNENFLWNRLRALNKLPGAYWIYAQLVRLLIKDGQLVRHRGGPTKGYLWRHYACYQPWMALGTYEPDVAQFIYQRLQTGQVFYDIGANAGYFSLLGAVKVGPTGKVIAFDPVPQNSKTVKEQWALNHLTEYCEVEALAISSRTDTTQLKIPTRNANAHLLQITAPHITEGIGEIIDVKCVTLDEYVKTHPKPNLIKVDIEGAEVEALKGAKHLLSAQDHRPEWLITAHSSDLASQVIEILTSAGYEIGDFPHMIHGIPKQ